VKDAWPIFVQRPPSRLIGRPANNRALPEVTAIHSASIDSADLPISAFGLLGRRF
jgi:hypothetical protein